MNRESIFLWRDFVISHDNFKTIWGPTGLLCEEKCFGVRIVKRGNPCIEIGMRIIPFAKAQPHVVVGLLLHRLNRRTNLSVVLLDSSKNLRTMDLAMVVKLTPDHILDSTEESKNLSIEGLRLLGRFSERGCSPAMISDPDGHIEHASPKRKRPAEVPSTIFHHFGFLILSR